MIKLLKITYLPLLTIFLVFLTATLFVTTLKNTKSLQINKLLENVTPNLFMYSLQAENYYFTDGFFQNKSTQSLSSITFSELTNIHFDDARSFIRNEIPGYSTYYSEIAIAGKGTDFTNIPQEGSIPMDDLNKEHSVDTNSIKKADETNKTNTKSPPTQTTNGKKVFLIYHTHSRESYLPLLPGTTMPDQATSPTANVSLVGERLKNELESNGIGAFNDKTDIGQLLLQKKLTYTSSYTASREVVQNALKTDTDVQYLIDLHRDDARKTLTTAKINATDYARISFVVGVETPNHQQNLELAKLLHGKLEAKYPGISRGVFQKSYKEGNGVYNQDLSSRAMLIEVGGVDNTLDELYRTADALGDVLSAYYWQDGVKTGN